MALAQLSDVRLAMLRDMTDDEAALTSALLERAEAILSRRIPDLLAETGPDEILVKMVETDAVCRVLNNPQGFIQEAEGGYSYAKRYEQASGRIQITDDEWAILGTAQESYTVDTLPGSRPSNAPPLWLSAVDDSMYG